jgi:phage-related protein (TIGR01555 family)
MTKTKAVARSARNGKQAAANERQANMEMALDTLIGGRSRLLGRLAGIQFGGNRDLYQVAGYVKPGAEKFEHYWGLYSRGDVAGRIVDMPAKTTWRTPPQVIEKGMPEGGTEFTKQFTKLANRLKLWNYFGRVDRLAGVGRYAVIVLGVKGAGAGQMSTPLTRIQRPDDILYLSCYHEANAEIDEWEQNVGDPRYGLPRIYKLKTANETNQGFRATDLRVHASRVIHVAEDCLEDDVYGRPRLQRCLNRLFDLDKVAASTGEAYWQLVSRILQAKIDKEMDVNDTQLKELDDKLGEMVHDLRRQFLGKGVNLEWLQGQTPNVKEVQDFYFSLIAGACGIPKRILFGSEMGELASSTDQETYFGLINERQEQFAEPSILRAFIDRLVLLGALPKPTLKDGEYEVVWPALFEEPDKDKATANLARAQTAQALTPVGGTPLTLVDIDAEGTIKLASRAHDDPMPEDEA